jgi:hypothetical protein
MQLYIAIQGQRQGPMSIDEVNAQLAQGRIPTESTLAWHEGCPEWIPLWQVAGVVLPSPPAPAPAPATVAPAASPDVLSSVIPYRNPMALTAYYLGIFSLIPVIGLLLALPAIVLGALGLGRSRRSAEAKGKAHAWTGIATGIVSVVGHVILMVLAGAR